MKIIIFSLILFSFNFPVNLNIIDLQNVLISFASFIDFTNVEDR